MSSNISLDSTDSDVFYLEQISNEPSPQRNNSPHKLNSTETSEHHAARMPSISTIASPQPYIFTINHDSNEPTIPSFSPKPERLELAAQSFQYLGDNGNSE